MNNDYHYPEPMEFNSFIAIQQQGQPNQQQTGMNSNPTFNNAPPVSQNDNVYNSLNQPDNFFSPNPFYHTPSCSPSYQDQLKPASQREDTITVQHAKNLPNELDFSPLGSSTLHGTSTDSSLLEEKLHLDMAHSDEKPVKQDNLTEKEIQARKKAQNRAAQRAFRERKEAKLKELERKLMESEQNRESLLKEVEQLRRQNLEINTENKLLLEKGGSSLPSKVLSDPLKDKFTFPTEDEFFSSIVSNHGYPVKKLSLHYQNEQGKKLLTVPATWEYLHRLSDEQDFDIYFVMENLKGKEVCHGHGPAYLKEVIDELVKNSMLED